MKIIGHTFRIAATALAFSFASICNANGIGFGDAVLLSSIGEPLHAEVAVLTDTALDDSCLSLAPPAAGEEKDPGYLRKASLKFETVQGRQHIVIRTSQPINEPYVRLRLQLKCPGMGSMEKTLTFLPDVGEAPKQETIAVAPTPPALQPTPMPTATVTTETTLPRRAAKVARTTAPAKAMHTKDEAFTFRLSAGLLDASRIGKAVPDAEPARQPSAQEGMQLQLTQLDDFSSAPAQSTAEPAPVPVPAPRTSIPLSKPAVVASPTAQQPSPSSMLPMAAIAAGLLLAAGASWLGWRRYAGGKSHKSSLPVLHESAAAAESLAVATPHAIPTAAGAERLMLEEAELYAIHGHPEKASAMLQDMVKRHPANEDAWLLLFSIYSAHKQGREFEHSAHAFQRHNPNSSSWKMIQALGRTIDADNPLYAGDDTLGAAAPFLPHIALGKRRPIGDVLVDMGFISGHELDEWLTGFNPKIHGRFGNYLVSHRMITHNQLNAALLRQQEENVGKPASGLPTLQDVENLVAGFDPQRDGNLGEFLVSRNLITPEQLGKVLHLEPSASSQTGGENDAPPPADDPSQPLDFYPPAPEKDTGNKSR